MEGEITLKRLVLVKRLYLEGFDKSAHEHNYSDQMLSVINLFLAVETLMGAVILAHDQQPEEAIGRYYIGGQPSPTQVSNFKLGDYHKFEQLFNQVVAILRDGSDLGEDERLYKWGSLERLQKARNDAQHGAKAPHPADLPELATIAREFIERILDLKWRISLNEVSLANLIKDNVLQQFIKHAETALAKGDRETCALLAWVAFLLGRLKRRYDWWKERKGHTAIDDFDLSQQISRDWGVRPLNDTETRLMANIMGQVLRLPYLFDNWALGLDAVDRSRLLGLTPRLVYYSEEVVDSPPSDEVVVVNLLDELISGKEDWAGPHFQTVPSENECLWVLSFITETLLRWQREERGFLTAVDPQYFRALTILEKPRTEGDA